MTTVNTFAIQVRTGKYVDLFDPHPDTISIADIAYGLARINRFNGHTTFPYSVAQHSILVSRLCPPDLRLAGLMHDSAEAYMCDMSYPLKMLMARQCQSFRGAWRTIEANLERAIMSAIGFKDQEEYLHCEKVKWADLRALATERRDLMPEDDVIWPIIEEAEPHEDRIRAMTVQEAQTAFLDEFVELTGGFR